MKYQSYKRAMALALISAMTAGATACGSQQTTQSPAPETIAETETSAKPEIQMTELVITADQQTTSTINGLDDGLCSWSTGGTDASTLNGDDYSMTPVVYINNGIYEADKSIAGTIDAVTDTEISNLNLVVEKEAVNGIIVNNSDYTIKDSSVNINVPEADGSETCDFSGVGSAIAVYGDLSTDSGSNMFLNVVNTSMSLTGNDEDLQADGTYNVENPYTQKSGYGTYAIGNAQETFLGTTMDVGTYATIFTGGVGYYGNLTAGESYELSAADGSTHYTYEAKEDVSTVINSDTFGFMSHQGDNECTLDGITVNSAFTDFIIKSGNNTTINVINDAKINAENGILLQLLDNDDSTTEFNPNDETVGMAFGTSHEEYAGFPTEAVDITAESDNSLADTLVAGGQPEDMGSPEGDAPDGAPGSAPGGAPDGAPGGAPDDAQVIIEDGVTLSVNGTVYEAGTYTAADFQ